ncbi:MAG TPA: hypothetical protein VFU73_13125 [Actinocrinis sp.]|nr:hypothetical protein [Actinocrinis sp.]
MATSSSQGRDDRLDRLRGPVPPRPYDARAIAALTANPGCDRRAVLDAAGVDKRAIAERLGSGPRFGQSPFAISRGHAFEKLVKADGGAVLLRLLRDALGLDLGAVEPAWTDLGDGDRRQRHQRTRELFAAAAADPGAPAVLADHPLLVLEVGGRTAYVEPDVVAFRVPGRVGAATSGTGPRWQLAEIKSFPMIDGRADPVKAGEAATQAAVYVLALQALMTGLGLSADLVSTDVVLICPKDFTNTPDAALVDVRRQLAAVRRQLDRLPSIGSLLDRLDSAVSFDLGLDADGQPTRDAADLGRAVSAIGARYAPECVSRCEMAFHCRDEARAHGSTDQLGRTVRDALGGVGTVRDVLALAEGSAARSAPSDDAVLGAVLGGGETGDGGLFDPEAARLLRTARRARDEALRSAAARESA